MLQGKALHLPPQPASGIRDNRERGSVGDFLRSKLQPGQRREASLQKLDAIPQSRPLTQLRREFEHVYSPEHPLRVALNELQSVEVMRIIEGKG